MTPRLYPSVRRQFPELVAAIRDYPSGHLANVRRADNWGEGWTAYIYRPRPWPDKPLKVAEATASTALGAFRAAVALMEVEV
jgi:hypothetical protein